MKTIKIFFLFVFLFFVSNLSIADYLKGNFLPEDNLNYPVGIDFLVNGTRIPSGSGFFLRDKEIIYLVTAKHVLSKSALNCDNFIKDKIVVSAYTRNSEEASQILFDLKKLKANNSILCHSVDDVLVIKMATNDKDKGLMVFEKGVEILRQVGKEFIGIPIEQTRRFDEVFIGNDVFVFGYPTSLSSNLLPEVNFNKPLLRKGIIAGKNSKGRAIIIDCFVNKGNSGGLVIEMDYIKGGGATLSAIGFITKLIPSIDHVTSQNFGYTNTIWENSGYSIVTPIDSVLELINKK